ncbi:MAG: glycosyltransferase family 4 protein [Acidobacteria bacterium]|nr:glycosyltransferase family 4 protein [Acidobacteriota bacterium]
MRIMVDATALLLRSAGVKGVLYHWIQAMRELPGGHEVLTYPPMRSIGALDHQRSVASAWATWKGLAMTIANQRLGVPFPRWHARGVDIFHCSNQVRIPPRNCRLTATVHDLTCWKMPELHTAGNVAADARYAENVLLRADRLIAVSENTRRDAVEQLGIAPDRIAVIPNGVSEEYFTAVPAEARRPYVLSVGTIEPRKNIDRLLDAWLGLPPAIREAFDLVIAGPQGWAAESTIARLQTAPSGIRWLGYVAEKDLPALTRGATLLAYPSLYEGFGLPLAQAMAAGVASVTSNVSSLPEVAAGSARLVDPLSVLEIRGALAALLEDPDERARLGDLGRRHALAQYRWPIVAQRSLAFFNQTAGILGS